MSSFSGQRSQVVQAVPQQPTLSPQALKALEQSRQRLSQLTNSLATLQRDILTSDPLPAWPVLSSLSNVIAQNLAALSAIHNEHSALLSSLVVYPNPAIYPSSKGGATGGVPEGLLEQLLRKKLEPGVEDWVEAGKARGQKEGDTDNLRELWRWAAPAANAEARKHAWGQDYTRAEVEGEGGVAAVRHGLRRKLRVPVLAGEDEEMTGEEDEDEDEEEEDDDTVMKEALGGMPVPKSGSNGSAGVSDLKLDPGEGSSMQREGGKPMPLAIHMRYLMTGIRP